MVGRTPGGRVLKTLTDLLLILSVHDVERHMAEDPVVTRNSVLYVAVLDILADYILDREEARHE